MHSPLPFTPRSLAKLGRGLLLAAVLAPAAHGQTIAPESFQNTTSSNYQLGGSARLTAGSGGDANGQGYLRLTDAEFTQSGYALGRNQIPSTQGFSLSFEFFSYGSTSQLVADGFSVFLVDADKATVANFVTGGTGGNLGYCGVRNGYLGIGVDEFGGFSINGAPRVGGRGFTPQSIALRGAGSTPDGDATYPYLGGTASLPYNLSVNTPRAQSGSPDYRRVFINAVPVNGIYRITVRLQHGSEIETVVDNLAVPAPPANLRVGLAGSTGDQNNIHELRKLEIARVPLLRQDSLSTRQGQPISLNVLSNDIFSFVGYQRSTVDLDIVQPGIQSTVTLPGKGTLSVSPDGLITFAPLPGFVGTLIQPYGAQDQVGQQGTPTNFKVTIDAAAPLPVTLTSFTVTARNQQGIVRWATASELNSDYFIVKRSLDGRTFTPVAKVAGHGTTTQSKSYEWVDTQIGELTHDNQPVYYQLQQVDNDGRDSFSPVAVARFGRPVALVATVAPNPTDGVVTLNLSGLVAGTYQVQLLSVMGQCLRTYSLAGQAQHELHIEDLPAGSYLLRITGNDSNQTLRLLRH